MQADPVRWIVREIGEPIRLIQFAEICVACYSVTQLWLNVELGAPASYLLLLNVVLGVLASYRDIDEFHRGRMEWEIRVLALYYIERVHDICSSLHK
jgi:hypothetical protein